MAARKRPGTPPGFLNGARIDKVPTVYTITLTVYAPDYFQAKQAIQRGLDLGGLHPDFLERPMTATLNEVGFTEEARTFTARVEVAGAAHAGDARDHLVRRMFRAATDFATIFSIHYKVHSVRARRAPPE